MNRSVFKMFFWPSVRLRDFLTITLIVANFCIFPTAESAAKNETEFKIKAAFLYKFCAYVQWPEHTFPQEDSPIVIAVVDDDNQLAEMLSVVAGRYIVNRPVVIQQIKSSSDLHGVHVLYVSRKSKTTISELITDTKPLPILTVTDAEVPSTPSIIVFLTINNRIRFEVSLAQSKSAGLKLSSELLSVAHKVYKGKRT
jgi:hypothetical protein